MRKFLHHKLFSASLAGLSFIDCDFVKCKFSNLSVTNATFENCQFINCKISNVEASFLSLIDCNFKECFLQGITLERLSVPHYFNITDSKVELMDLRGLSLQQSVFAGNSYDDCCFEECDLKKSIFSRSTFSETEFRRCDLSYCDFSDTTNLDLNQEINNINKTKIPYEAGLKILKRMNIFIV